MTELNELTAGKTLKELKDELAFQISNGEAKSGTICSHIKHVIRKEKVYTICSIHFCLYQNCGCTAPTRMGGMRKKYPKAHRKIGAWARDKGLVNKGMQITSYTDDYIQKCMEKLGIWKGTIENSLKQLENG